MHSCSHRQYCGWSRIGSNIRQLSEFSCKVVLSSCAKTTFTTYLGGRGGGDTLGGRTRAHGSRKDSVKTGFSAALRMDRTSTLWALFIDSRRLSAPVCPPVWKRKTFLGQLLIKNLKINKFYIIRRKIAKFRQANNFLYKEKHTLTQLKLIKKVSLIF